MSTEYSTLNIYAQVFKDSYALLIDTLIFLGLFGTVKRWSVSMVHICRKRKLADEKDRSSLIHYRKIHLPVIILETSESDDFLQKTLKDRCILSLIDTKVYKKS